jgi:hypothetical protein
MRNAWVVTAVLFLWLGFVTAAQEEMPINDDIENHPWVVFLQRDDLGERLIFVDMLTGSEIAVETQGERYTPVGRSVMFFDTNRRRVMVATPDGRVREHPFIRLTGDFYRVDWVVSPNQAKIAWTVTTVDAQNRLSTVTTIANIDGTEQQVVLTDVDNTGNNLRALPLAFSKDLKTLYMDVYPDAIGSYTPFDLYAGIFGLDVASGEPASLPGEPSNCLCGADLGAEMFLRLRLTDDLGGFDLHVYNLTSQIEQVIPALSFSNYTSAGDVLISPDGKRAVYALARVNDFGSPEQTIQTVFVLADLVNMTQEALTNPITTFVRPMAWTEDSSAIIFTGPGQDGTWKISLEDRRLAQIAAGSYIGRLQ